MVDYADKESSLELEADNEVDSKDRVLRLDLSSGATCSKANEESKASSSHSHVKSYFVGMGFSPALVDKAIEENGEDNADLLLETLFAYNAIEKSKPESSDSLDDLLGDCKNGSSTADFAIDGPELKAIVKSSPASSDSLEIFGNCKDGSNGADVATNGPKLKAIQKLSPQSSDSLDELFGDSMDGNLSGNFAADGPKLKEELNSPSELWGEKRASLLMMDFSVQEVDLAISRLGEGAPVNELVDFIVASQIAQSSEQNINDSTPVGDANDQENATESLFQSMEKTLSLLEMGFTEDEISSAIEKYGPEVPVGELADSIFANRIADSYEDDKDATDFNSWLPHGANGWRSPESSLDPLDVKIEPLSSFEEHNKHHSFDAQKAEPSSSNAFLNKEDIDFREALKGKKPKHECEDYPNAFLAPSMPVPRTSEPKSSREPPDETKIPQHINSNPCKSVRGTLAQPPYFFYGNVMDSSQDTWSKLSQFMYAISPEFGNSQNFSILSRKEGYIHNLPTDDRSFIYPKPPMTIEDALPHLKKWWPSWDTRKQLTRVSYETNGISQICERLGKTLTNGILTKDQQTDILHQCKTLNLVWVGKNKLSPIEPEQLETILGYPECHTDVVNWDLVERLRLLRHSFQTDTLGYHLSALKQLYPNGLTVLSIYSGTGGAEVALHRLGIRLKNVVSVELCEIKRSILRLWWHKTGQKGELLQLEDCNKLTSNKLKSLMRNFGGFDLVIGQNPCPNTSGSSKADREALAGFDFTLFFEFVRVMQCVRSEMACR